MYRIIDRQHLLEHFGYALKEEGRFIDAYSVRRILPNFNLRQGGIDNATVAKLRDSGLDQLVSEQLATQLWQDNEYELWMYPKSVPTLPYESLITLLPKYDATKVTSSVGTMSTPTLLEVMRTSYTMLKSVKNVALDDGKSVDYGFIFQHIGPHDAYPKAPFNTSYLPFHLHIQTYGYSLDEFPLFRQTEPIDTHAPQYRSMQYDPLLMVARDVLRSKGIRVEVRGNTALVLAESEIDQDFTYLDALMLQAFYREWERNWQIIMECMTDFSEDQYGRHALYERSERLARLEGLLQNEYQYVSTDARRALTDLAHHSVDNTDDTSRWIYKGVNGTLGYEFDYTKGKKRVIFAPKLLTNVYRHFDLVNQDFMIVKDKKDTTLAPHEERQQIIDIQKRIIKKYRAKA